MRMVKLIIAGGVLGLAAIGFLGAPAAAVTAQEDSSCQLAYQAAIEALVDACSALAPGEVCGGASGAVLVDQAGSSAPAAGVSSLNGLAQIMTQVTPESDVVGLSVMRVPALEDGRYFTGVLFGGAILRNEPGLPQAPACNARSIGTVNIRAEPNTDAAILGQLQVDEVVPVIGSLADGTWWRIRWEGEPAWVFAELTPADCEPASMLIYDPVTGEVSGGLPAPDFQGGELETSFVAPVCSGVPGGGLLLQSESDGGSWRLNDMLLSLDGTALFQGAANDVLVAQVLEGQLVMQINGTARVAQVGQLLRIPLRLGQAAAVPGPALDSLSVEAGLAPLALLPRQIALPEASMLLPAVSAPGACGLLPQQFVLTPSGGTASLDIVAGEASAIRVSAAGNGVTGLSVANASGQGEEIQGEGSLAVDLYDLLPAEDGYRIDVTTTGTDPVTVGVTCDLPRAQAPQEVAVCNDMLLTWDEVIGGGVQFEAPYAARVSVIAQHPLPSQGAAGQLLVVAGDGELVAQMPFAAFDARQVAGPLNFEAPVDATYSIQWDGDPFNAVTVEVVCEMPVAESAE